MELNEKTKQILDVLDGGKSKFELAILPIVNAINSLHGIRTRSSCGGHCNRYPYVHFWVDGSSESMTGLCLISHAIKHYNWLLVAVPRGSIGDLFLEFAIMPALSFKEGDVGESIFGFNSSSPRNVEIEQTKIDNIAGRLLALRKNSRYVPQIF
jgi:hypothetical protein